jgi:GMP synthase-like glutamine amidotransferase
MRALVIQHDHVSPPGPIGDRLRHHGIDVDHHEIVPAERFATPGVTTQFPSLANDDLVVIMGAPWSAYDVDLIGSWLLPELDLIREADARGIPILGICFGGQLISAALGGSVARAERPEIGWVSIETDDPSWVPEGPWFQWHFDCWTMPPEAREIARDEVASQAYLLRQHLAVQFHPELTVEMLAGWLGNGGDVAAVKAGFDPAVLMEDTIANEEAARQRAYDLVDSFLAHNGLGEKSQVNL